MWQISQGTYMFTTQQDLLKISQDFYKSFPKTENEFRTAAQKVKNIYLAEAEKSAQVARICIKAASGDATANEIADASKKAQELAVAARFAAFLSLPGAVFALPVAIKAAKELDIDFIPNSVIREFAP